MEHDEVLRWVRAYEQVWRERAFERLPELFTTDATYLEGPYEPPHTGLAAIRELWEQDGGLPFTMTAEPFAVEGRSAVVRVEVHYLPPKDQRYRDLWLLRFGVEGRVEAFEEWADWPGRGFVAPEQTE